MFVQIISNLSKLLNIYQTTQSYFLEIKKQI